MSYALVSCFQPSKPDGVSTFLGNGGAPLGTMMPRATSRSPPGTVPFGALPPSGGWGSGALGDISDDVGLGAAGGLANAPGGNPIASVAPTTRLAVLTTRRTVTG